MALHSVDSGAARAKAEDYDHASEERRGVASDARRPIAPSEICWPWRACVSLCQRPWRWTWPRARSARRSRRGSETSACRGQRGRPVRPKSSQPRAEGASFRPAAVRAARRASQKGDIRNANNLALNGTRVTGCLLSQQANRSTPQRLVRVESSLLREAGVREARLHDVRHTAATFPTAPRRAAFRSRCQQFVSKIVP
jgi:hypothetical protein